MCRLRIIVSTFGTRPVTLCHCTSTNGTGVSALFLGTSWTGAAVDVLPQGLDGCPDVFGTHPFQCRYISQIVSLPDLQDTLGSFRAFTDVPIASSTNNAARRDCPSVLLIYVRQGQVHGRSPYMIVSLIAAQPPVTPKSAAGLRRS